MYQHQKSKLELWFPFIYYRNFPNFIYTIFVCSANILMPDICSFCSILTIFPERKMFITSPRLWQKTKPLKEIILVRERRRNKRKLRCKRNPLHPYLEEQQTSLSVHTKNRIVPKTASGLRLRHAVWTLYSTSQTLLESGICGIVQATTLTIWQLRHRLLVVLQIASVNQPSA